MGLFISPISKLPNYFINSKSDNADKEKLYKIVLND